MRFKSKLKRKIKRGYKMLLTTFTSKFKGLKFRIRLLRNRIAYSKMRYKNSYKKLSMIIKVALVFLEKTKNLLLKLVLRKKNKSTNIFRSLLTNS